MKNISLSKMAAMYRVTTEFGKHFDVLNVLWEPEDNMKMRFTIWAEVLYMARWSRGMILA